MRDYFDCRCRDFVGRDGARMQLIEVEGDTAAERIWMGVTWRQAGGFVRVKRHRLKKLGTISHACGSAPTGGRGSLLVPRTNNEI